MAYKIYKRGAFVIIENTVNGELKELNSQFVQIVKGKTSLDQYEVLYNGVSQLKAVLGDILDSNGVAYVEADWDIFRYEQCGSVNSSEVANPYPAPTTTVVDITSAQILGTASTDIELLPNLAAGSYYDSWVLTLELDFNSIAYDLGVDVGMYLYWGSRGVLIDKTFIESAADNVITIHSNDLIDLTNTPLSTVKGLDTVNSGVFLTTNTVAPITGNSPMRALLSYSTRTFGA